MTAAVAIEHVSKNYDKLQALLDVSFRVEQGEFFALLGPNGAGKTTLITILAGLARASAGTIKVMGHDTVTDYRSSRRNLGVVPQELVFDPFFTVRETLRFQSGYFGLKKNDAWIDELLANLDLTSKADVNTRQLSGGMKRRLLVAQALVHRPPVIVLDEPTAGVDVGLRQSLWHFIAKLNRDGHSIILTTHYLEEAETLCSRIAMLKNGQVVALDTTRNLLNAFGGQTVHARAANLPDPWQQKAQWQGDRFTVNLADVAEVEALLAACRTRDIVLKDLAVSGADLEQVFLKLTGNNEARA